MRAVCVVCVFRVVYVVFLVRAVCALCTRNFQPDTQVVSANTFLFKIRFSFFVDNYKVKFIYFLCENRQVFLLYLL